MPRRFTIFSFVSVLGLVADQLSKSWARGSLPYGREVPFIGSFWSWELSYNPGSAFGLFNGTPSAKYFLSIIGVVAAVWIIVHVARKADLRAWPVVALGMLWAGAVGNVIDRILFGKVTDFVLWQTSFYRHPQFNVADALLVAGIIILVLGLGEDKKKPPAK